MLPYVLAWALRRPPRERLAAGIGGYAPDADAFTAALYLLDERIYFLGHRGLSHSLLGAPLYALAVAGILSLPWWGRRWPRLQALRFTRPMLVACLLASFTHLALDAVTMWGIPLLFPFSPARPGLDWYFYSVLWVVPISAWFCWGVWKGRADDRFVRRWGALLVAALLLSGGARLALRPDAPEDARVLPTGAEWDWAVVRRVEGGWEMQEYTWRRAGLVERLNASVPPDPGAQAALEAARASVQGKRFLLYSSGPIAEVVAPAPGGAWNVTLYDLTREAQYVGAMEFVKALGRDRSRLDLVVDAEGAVRKRD